jgi:hypothetical protein
MTKKNNYASSLHLPIKIYQALISIYPSEFRRDYGDLMVQVFGDCCRQAFREAGMSGLLLLWWRTLLDTVKTAIEEHSQRGVYMAKQTFIKLSGWLLILGAIAASNVRHSQPGEFAYRSICQCGGCTANCGWFFNVEHRVIRYLPALWIQDEWFWAFQPGHEHIF